MSDNNLFEGSFKSSLTIRVRRIENTMKRISLNFSFHFDRMLEEPFIKCVCLAAGERNTWKLFRLRFERFGPFEIKTATVHQESSTAQHDSGIFTGARVWNRAVLIVEKKFKTVSYFETIVIIDHFK